MEKSADAFRTISEVAADLALPQHVLRFWEQRFPQIKPLKRAGGRRYYRPLDVLLLRSIRRLLYDEGYTIKGVQRLLKEQGARGLRADEPGSAVLDDLALDDLALDIPPLGLVEPVSELADASESDPSVAEEPVAGSPVANSFGLALRDALACIEDCERILAAVHRARP